MSQPESRLQRRIRQALERRFGGYWWKIWGGPFTPAGLPDLAGVVDGRAVFVEVKRPGGQPSRAQLATHRRLRAAGAIVVAAATSAKEAVDELDSLLSPHDDRAP